MKLSELTRSSLGGHLGGGLPYPNMRTWATLAVDMSEHIMKFGRDDYPEEEHCWLWFNAPSKRKMYVIHNSPEQGKTIFTLQIKRFAFYIYNLEAQLKIINEAYHSMISKPKKFLHNQCNCQDCFNPDHLIESYTSFDVNKAYEHKKGVECKQAKLTEDQVYDIYGDFTKGGESIKNLSEFYKVSKATVYCIVTGRTWKHLDLPPIRVKERIK